jgi:Phage integrase, N-terminal SAM-like domain
MARRSYGTGSLFIARGKWVGQWRVDGQLTKRVIGPKREPGSREGLTRKMAEAELRRRMQEEIPATPPTGTLTLSEAGDRYLTHLETVIGRKPATIQDYRIILTRHLVPFFGERGIDRIEDRDVDRFLSAQVRSGAARQSIINRLNLLGGTFTHAVKRGWARSNPVGAVDRPHLMVVMPTFECCTWLPR